MGPKVACAVALRSLSLVLAILLHTLGHSGASAAPKRIALVIGNAAYVNAPRLTNPLNDAKAVGEALQGLGFNVHLVLDATQQQLLKELDLFAAALLGAEAALLYYSGHGIQLDGAN